MSIINSFGKKLPPVLDLAKSQEIEKDLEIENIAQNETKKITPQSKEATPLARDRVEISTQESIQSVPDENLPSIDSDIPPAVPMKKKLTMEELRSNWEASNPAASVKLGQEINVPEPIKETYIVKRSQELMDVLKNRSKPKEVEIRSILPPSKYGPQSAPKKDGDPELA